MRTQNEFRGGGAESAALLRGAATAVMAPTEQMAVALRLSEAERKVLEECERTIERGLQTFVEVAEALARVRDGKLYRQSHTTFEAYCRERWSVTAHRMRQISRAAGVVKNLGEGARAVDVVDGVDKGFSGAMLPKTESQARPLAGLTPEQQCVAWKAAVKKAPGGVVTAKHVQEAADELRASAPPVDGGEKWPRPNEHGVYTRGAKVHKYRDGKVQVSIEVLQIGDVRWISAVLWQIGRGTVGHAGNGEPLTAKEVHGSRETAAWAAAERALRGLEAEKRRGARGLSAAIAWLHAQGDVAHQRVNLRAAADLAAKRRWAARRALDRSQRVDGMDPVVADRFDHGDEMAVSLAIGRVRDEARALEDALPERALRDVQIRGGVRKLTATLAGIEQRLRSLGVFAPVAFKGIQAATPPSSRQERDYGAPRGQSRPGRPGQRR